MKQIKKYVAFNPSSSEGEEWWTADTIKQLVWNLRHIHEVYGTLSYSDGIDGKYFFENLEIYNTQIHPKVKEVLD